MPVDALHAVAFDLEELLDAVFRAFAADHVRRTLLLKSNFTVALYREMHYINQQPGGCA
jgi:hypothetical protein